jgi:hypothetical protein
MVKFCLYKKEETIMSYEFKTLGSVEALTEVPENANALVEVDGAIKRVPGGALGGNEYDLVITDESVNGIITINSGSYQNVFNKISAKELPRILVKYAHDYGDTTSMGVTESFKYADIVTSANSSQVLCIVYDCRVRENEQILVEPDGHIEATWSVS